MCILGATGSPTKSADRHTDKEVEGDGVGGERKCVGSNSRSSYWFLEWLLCIYPADPTLSMSPGLCRGTPAGPSWRFDEASIAGTRHFWGVKRIPWYGRWRKSADECYQKRMDMVENLLLLNISARASNEASRCNTEPA